MLAVTAAGFGSGIAERDRVPGQPAVVRQQQLSDFFAPVVDDAYTFGRIAATNALSDIYAMGGEPMVAVNLPIIGELVRRRDSVLIIR